MRSVLPAVLRATLLSFLLVSSGAILYATVMNERTVKSLADRSLESTAIALSAVTESALRTGGSGTDSEVQEILSDRVVAYALIAERDGTIRFHTNPRMTGNDRPQDEIEGESRNRASPFVVSIRYDGQRPLNILAHSYRGRGGTPDKGRD